MAWKLKYDAPKGLRTNRNFWSVTTFDMWYVPSLEKWMYSDECMGFDMSTHHNKPKTTKAFLRYLQKHPELKGDNCNFG